MGRYPPGDLNAAVFQPYFGFLPSLPDVDMRRFLAVHTVEEKTVSFPS
jgi:hypothetical protein